VLGPAYAIGGATNGDELTSQFNNANKKYPNGWVVKQCHGDGCDCGPDTRKSGDQTITLTDEIIDQTGPVKVIGTIHCIIEIGGTLKVTGDGCSIDKCVPSKKESDT
jgi:hypothetical protein